jgi:hypothetical protein
MKKKRLPVLACAAGMGLSPCLAFSQTSDSWKWQGAIYAYLPDISGKTTFPGGAGSSATVDAGTIVDNLKFTFMGFLGAHNGRWGVFTDVVYMDLGNTKRGSRDITIGGTPLPAGADAAINFDLKGLAWTLGGEWRLVSKPTYTMDLIAGARLFNMTQKIDWEVAGNIASIPIAGRSGKSEAKINNWDAIVGVKGRAGFGDGNKWFAPYYLDVGTGESDLTWQAMAGLGYSFHWGEVVAAWRYVDYEMKSGKKVEGITFNGPAIAAVFHW